MAAFVTTAYKSNFLMRFPLWTAILLAFFFIACNSDDDGDQHATDIQQIEQYLLDNQLTAQSTDSGLHYIITKDGLGDHPNLQSEVKMRYRGYLLDGTVFDQVTGTDFIEFPLSGFIPGWQEGVQKFKKGGEGTLLIPSRLGYGNRAQGSIPANSVLLFDIELIDFQ